MTKNSKFFKNFLVNFVLLVTSEILSHCPRIYSFYWLKEDVQWITHKAFRKKFRVSSGFDHFLQFLLNFWLLPDFFVVFRVNRLVAMSY